MEQALQKDADFQIHLIEFWEYDHPRNFEHHVYSTIEISRNLIKRYVQQILLHDLLWYIFSEDFALPKPMTGRHLEGAER